MRLRFLIASAAVAALCTLSTQVSAQAAAATVCTDGSTSATTGRGACSGHGGVDKKATAAAKKAAKASAKAAKTSAMVSCTDGTMSKGGRGACSKHGGVAAAGAAAATTMPAPAPAPPPATPAARPPAAPAAAPAAAPSTDRVRPASTSNASNATGGSGKPEDNDPTGAIAKCKDGMYSHSAHRSGSCSGHGGVAQWLDK